MANGNLSPEELAAQDLERRRKFVGPTGAPTFGAAGSAALGLAPQDTLAELARRARENALTTAQAAPAAQGTGGSDRVARIMSILRGLQGGAGQLGRGILMQPLGPTTPNPMFERLLGGLDFPRLGGRRGQAKRSPKKRAKKGRRQGRRTRPPAEK